MRLGMAAVKRLITALGFVPQDGKNGVYRKRYANHGGYFIVIDLNAGKIVYDAEENQEALRIKVWEKTAGSLFRRENFVILECVDGLLEKGYGPSCIELGKAYPPGHGRLGRLDILVRTQAGRPFLMIECKAWGAKYDQERFKMLKNGGPLFSFYTNDRAVKYLCLYTSRIEKNRERQNAVVDVDDGWSCLSGVKEIHDHWNKNFKDNGIFDGNAAPYEVKHKALTYGRLQTLKEEDSGKIFNQIMEILRHNAISDKPNAFNKLLNLFVCKIIDEDKNPEDELLFQWLESDDYESLQLRLGDLYKEGMWRFLDIDVIDYRQDEVIRKLEGVDLGLQRWILKMYKDIRLKKSPDFAFIEVQDDRTFVLNGKVVREIVELLQVYKFRYAQKHAFLGDFFELLLNTSMKQEAGQFFTPVPITRFMISALPLKELVQQRVDKNRGEPLPAVIDYACGSGHFLTEYMSQMQELIDRGEVDVSHAGPSVKKYFMSWQELSKFLWAKNTVYGIDLDNRLVKTAKVSAFFNGDGEANIVWANGLDSFARSGAFRGKLRCSGGRDNGQFDILISNPPYSVDSFKGTIEYGNESFELYPYLTDNSSEIECLFVERMKQLLKAGGLAAVILPSSILTNSGIHARAREILLKYFKVRAMVEAGANTFMKTNTNTVILFLERRGNDDCLNINREIHRFFSAYRDVTVAGIENAFSTYVSCVYEGLSLNDYISLIKGEPDETAMAHELYADYAGRFGEKFSSGAAEAEKEKLLYFLLTYSQTTVLVKTGKGKEEKRFLGYEFSERRGHEGLHQLPAGTMLYDEKTPLNPKKASSYIYHSFLGEQIEIDESIASNITYGRMSGFLEFGTGKFDKTINLGKVTQAAFRWRPVKVGELLLPIKGPRTKVPQGEVSEAGSVPVVSQDSSKLVIGYSSGIQPIVDLPLVLMGDHTCVFKYIDFPFACGSDNTKLLKFDGRRIIPKFAYYILSRSIIQNAQKYERHFRYVKDMKIPLPPPDIQQAVVDALERAENEERALNEEAAKIGEEIALAVEACYPRAAKIDKLQRAVHYSTERIRAEGLNRDTYVGVENLLPGVEGKRPSDYVPASGSVTAYHRGDILLSNIRPYLKKAWLADNDGGSSGDILVLRTAAAVALPEYVFLHTSSDRFFEYEMHNIGSNVKMPRADKKKVLDYQIPFLSLEEQKKVVAEVAGLKEEIGRIKARFNELNAEKEAVMKRYLE